MWDESGPAPPRAHALTGAFAGPNPALDHHLPPSAARTSNYKPTLKESSDERHNTYSTATGARWRRPRTPHSVSATVSSLRLAASLCGIMRRMNKVTSKRLIVGIVATLILGFLLLVTFGMTDFIVRVVHVATHILQEGVSRSRSGVWNGAFPTTSASWRA
jgi:hypothetical protein